MTAAITWDNDPSKTQTVAVGGVEVSVGGLEQLLLVTGSGDDVLRNILVGTDDVFITGDGNDTINAGAGNDRLEGEKGNDTLEDDQYPQQGQDEFAAMDNHILDTEEASKTGSEEKTQDDAHEAPPTKQPEDEASDRR